jgi:hypothetical protein
MYAPPAFRIAWTRGIQFAPLKQQQKVRRVAQLCPAFFAFSAAVVRSDISRRSFSAKAAYRCKAAVQRHRLPHIVPLRQFVSRGGLMSYGPDNVDIFRRSAKYADRILSGDTRPSSRCRLLPCRTRRESRFALANQTFEKRRCCLALNSRHLPMRRVRLVPI